VIADEPEKWSDLFVASAGASAALAGLVFVAVSINVERILQYKGLPERALSTVLLLLGVVVVSILGCVPGASATALGIELLVAGLALTAAVTLLTRQSLAQRGESADHVFSAVVTTGPGTLAYLVGGISLIAGAGGGLYWILAGILGAIIGGVINAWVLLVEILR
jgi:modulator of FtsH protease